MELDQKHAQGEDVNERAAAFNRSRQRGLQSHSQKATGGRSG